MKKNKLLLRLVLLFLMTGFFIQSKAQTADLMDVRFQTSGQAKNVAPSGTLSTPLAITTPSTLPLTVFEPSVNQFVSRFDGSSGPVYKLLYKDNGEFNTALTGSFTIETYVKANTHSDMCPVSAQESGGFGVEHKGNNSGNTQLWYNYDNGGRKTVTVGDQSIYNAALGANQQYYHLVYVVNRTGNNATITAYYNGVANGSATITGAYFQPGNADARWIGIGGDAHPTYVSQYWWNGDVAFARMYSTALDQTQITGLYNQINTRKALTKVDDLNTQISNKLPAYIGFTTDPVKKTKAQNLLAEGWDIMNDLTVTDVNIQTYLDKIVSELGSLEPAVSPFPNVVIISDTHVGNDKGWSVKLNRGIDQLIAQSPKLDAVFINGDVTDWGTPSQLTAAKNIFSRLEQAVPVYYLMGNHDWYNSLTQSGIDFQSYLGQPLNQYVVIKGYPFITISMETSAYATAYQQTSQDFLTAKIAQAKIDCPGKPIIVMSHMPVTGTVYGSYTIGGGDSWGTNGLKAICEANPEVILFSGHSHYPLGDERSIHQDKFTSINEGSMTYSEIETGKSEGIHPPGYTDVTEGCFVIVQANGDVKIKRWDFFRQKEIKQPWLVKAPFDGTNFTYKNRTGGTAPYFEVTDKPTVSTITDNACKVTFPQAKDDDLVHHYLVELLDKDNVVLAAPKYTVFSRFYLNEDQPNSLDWNITGLSETTKYSVRVTGIDSYGNVSVPPIVSDQFTTLAYQVNPLSTLATPDLLDVKFKSNSTAIDLSAKNWTITKGSTNPNTVYDGTLKQYVNKSVGTSSQYFKVDYQNDESFKTILKAGFTLEVYTKFGAIGSIAQSPVSSQEGGGFGIERNTNGTKTEFWFRNSSTEANGSGSYVNSNVGTLDINRYYHLVFTWSKTAGKIIAYLDGVPVAQTTAAGLALSATASAQWIGIGGDANGGTAVQSAFKGDIATTRMYSKVLSRDEAILAYQQILARQALTKVDDLNTAITSTIPNASQLNETQKSDLLDEGWALMNNLATTDAQIITFLNKLQGVLPVNITSFKANTKGSHVQLSWTTASEKNSAYFNLFRSTDGINYVKIGTVTAAGNSTAPKFYQFSDNKASAGINYYQLQQVDKDGTVTNFNYVVSANLIIGLNELNVFANTSGKLIAAVQSTSISKGKLTARTILGQKLAEVDVIVVNGQNQFEIPVHGYKGIVLVSIDTDKLHLSKKTVL